MSPDTPTAQPKAYVVALDFPQPLQATPPGVLFCGNEAAKFRFEGMLRGVVFRRQQRPMAGNRLNTVLAKVRRTSALIEAFFVRRQHRQLRRSRRDGRLAQGAIRGCFYVVIIGTVSGEAQAALP